GRDGAGPASGRHRAPRAGVGHAGPAGRGGGGAPEVGRTTAGEAAQRGLGGYRLLLWPALPRPRAWLQRPPRERRPGGAEQAAVLEPTGGALLATAPVVRGRRYQRADGHDDDRA